MQGDRLVIKKKRRRGEDGYKVFSIRIPEDVVERIDGIAYETGHSRNYLITRLIVFALDYCQVEECEGRA